MRTSELIKSVEESLDRGCSEVSLVEIKKTDKKYKINVFGNIFRNRGFDCYSGYSSLREKCVLNMFGKNLYNRLTIKNKHN